jgi:hypothetical protein
LRRRYYQGAGNAAGVETIRSAIDLLEARAQFDAPERPVHIRVAEHDDHIYLDLAVSRPNRPDGWQVVTFPPVRFRRAAGTLPLPFQAPNEFMLVRPLSIAAGDRWRASRQRPGS